MKRIWLSMMMVLMALPPAIGAAEEPDFEVSNLSVNGVIDGENITFTLTFDVETTERESTIPLVVGDVAYMKSDFPRDSVLRRNGNQLYLDNVRRGRHKIKLQFASRPAKNGDWRTTQFDIPVSNIRRLSVECDRDDLEVRFANAMNVKRAKNEAEKTTVTAFLGLTRTFNVQWKPEVKKLAAETVVSVEANTIATASVGAMRIDTVYTYRVVQGVLTEMRLDIPEDLNVTRVQGEAIQDWLASDTGNGRVLHVALSRPHEGEYRLQITSEMILPKFPCDVLIPVINPREVIRASGFLMIGTDSAIKLVVDKAGGLTQVDQSAFPVVTLDAEGKLQRSRPGRSPFVYQYANSPYTLALKADDIVPDYSADERLILMLRDNNLEMLASVDLDIRDAPAAELSFETDPEWTVANVAGDAYSDHDVRTVDGRKVITVYFKKAMMGRMLLEFRLENTMADGATKFKVPSFAIAGAKNERGKLYVAADKGLRLKEVKATGIRQMHTGSADVQLENLQAAYRFKDAGWAVELAVDRNKSVIHSEIFHLLSIGDGTLYGSATVNYLVRDAPVRSFVLRVPAAYRNVEFVGVNISDWKQNGDLWTVNLRDKVSGDYTLLVTYDLPYNYEGDDLKIGGLETVGSDREVGYMALSSASSLKLETMKSDASVFRIDDEEIPPAYVLPVQAPILGAYKYTQIPHVVDVRLIRYGVENLLSQVVDHTAINTEISKDGEAVTRATYYVKNTQHQYLSVKLPDGAALWSTRLALIDDEGQEDAIALKDVRSLRGENDAVLIPLMRPRNPNQFMKVEVVYAESFDTIGIFGSPFALRAPTTPTANMTIARWDISAPENHALAAPGGNMTVDWQNTPDGMYNVWKLIRTSGQHVVPLVPWLLPVVTLFLFLCGLWYARGRGRGHVVAVLLGIPAVAGSGLAALLGTGFLLQGTLAAPVVQTVIRTLEFSKNVSLAKGEPLLIEMMVVPQWMGGGTSVLWLAVPAVAGIVLLLIGLKARPRNSFLLALGATGICMALSTLDFGPYIVAGLSVILVGVMAIVMARRMMVALYNIGVRHYERQLALAGNGIVEEKPFEKLDDVPAAGETNDSARTEEASETETSSETEESSAEVEEDSSESSEDEESVDESVASGEAEETEAQAESDEPEQSEENDEPQASAEKDDEAEESESGEDDDMDDDSKRDGFSTVRMLWMMALLFLPAFVAIPSFAKRVAAPAPEPVVVMDNVAVQITGPGIDKEAERSATVVKTLTFAVEDPVRIPVIGPQDIVIDYKLDSKYLELGSDASGYYLEVTRKGSYEVEFTYLTRVTEQDGVWSLKIAMQDNLRNEVTLSLPESGLDIQSDEAVLFRVNDEKGKTTATAVYGPSRAISFVWQPRVRRTQLEEAVYYCEVNTMASFDPGVVDLASLVQYQIAQGELKQLSLQIPEGMNVTSVSASGLSTWRFDPDARLLEAVLARPVSGRFNLLVYSQVASEGLPYTAKIGSPVVVGADRQRGSLAVAAPDTVQVQMDELEGLNAMNIEDFSATVVNMATANGKKARAVKRAFRFHKLPVSASVQARRVLPEIRVRQEGAIDISDEYVKLSTRLNVNVTRTGVFSITLNLPDEYDIETLTADDMSHWDDLKEEGSGIVVHFNNQAIEDRAINLVLSRASRGIEDRVSVPRVTVKGARKHTGRLVIRGEQGVRMTVVDSATRGVSRPADIVSRADDSTLVFDLLRPTWVIELETEIMKPTIRPSILHRVDLAEGIVKGRVHVEYDIENAGNKVFLLQAPAPGVALAVSGDRIAKVHRIDDEQGIWEVVLHEKFQERYQLEVSYQIPFEQKTIEILPVQPLGTETPKSHLVVMSRGRVQVQTSGQMTGLTPADAGTIPKSNAEGDLSDAIMCYRSVKSDYALPLSVVRHGSADVLPATVKGLALTSVVSDSGDMLTRAELKLTVGDLRFLKVTLPDKENRLWSSFVDGKVAEPSRDDGGIAYRIPLDETDPQQVTTVELIYESRTTSGEHKYKGPNFDLPLANISWEFYMSDGPKYYGFDGTMTYQKPDRDSGAQRFTEADYISWNRQQIGRDRQRARQDMVEAEQLSREGNQMLANAKLAAAADRAYTQADHEDARIQYLNQITRQYIVGNVQRRGQLREAQNIRDEKLEQQLRRFNDGAYTSEWAAQVADSLEADDNRNLASQAERFIEQQAAAAGLRRAIRVTMPEYGQKLVFNRSMQIERDAFMTVEFEAADVETVRWGAT